jgi:hypothetical protein
MKKGELYDFFENVSVVNLSGSKFTYTVTKNKRKIEKFLKEFDKEREPNEAYKEYIKEIESLKVKVSNKDDKGKPIIIDGQLSDGTPSKFYDIPDKDNPDGEWMKWIEKIKEDFKDEIDEQKEKEKHFVEVIMQEEIEFTPHFVNISDVPKDITQQEMDLIYWMIDEK